MILDNKLAVAICDRHLPAVCAGCSLGAPATKSAWPWRAGDPNRLQHIYRVENEDRSQSTWWNFHGDWVWYFLNPQFVPLEIDLHEIVDAHFCWVNEGLGWNMVGLNVGKYSIGHLGAQFAATVALPNDSIPDVLLFSLYSYIAHCLYVSRATEPNEFPSACFYAKHILVVPQWTKPIPTL